MTYFGLNSVSSVSTLFSSLNSGSGQSSVSSAGNFLADYASIRSGSYYKLLKAYYNTSDNSKVSNVVKTATSVSKDSTKTLSRIESSAEDLKETADALLAKGTKNVFQKVDVKQEDGTVTKDYDTEAIYSKVSEFVDSYNSLIEDAEDTNTSSIQRNLEQMENLSYSNKRMLNKIGITINKDDTLSIDKDTFMKADMEVVKGMFNGTGSYGYSVSAKASMIDYYAQNEASKANTYGSGGAYNYNYTYGSNYSSYI